MELQFDCSDDYLENLPITSSLSTLPSEGSLDDLNMLKQTNDCLRKELEKMSEEFKKVKKIADQQAGKDFEIETLRQALEKALQERDSLQLKLDIMAESKTKFKAVANPLQTVLINRLIEKGVIKSKRIEQVMRSIDRGDFCPRDPYVDSPQTIGFNTTVSAPHMHGHQLEILKECFKNAKKAIDIGTGSGYVALSLAKMMDKPDMKVYAVDHIPKIVERAKENISKNHKEYLDQGKIEFIIADGREGLPQHAPYDIMFVGGAVSTVPEAFLDQLALGGSLVLPVGDFYQNLTVIHKTQSGEILRNSVLSVSFGKLQSVEEQYPDIDE